MSNKEKKKLREIYEYIIARKDSYFNSQCYTSLLRRRDKLQSSIDMQFHSGRLGRLNSQNGGRLGLEVKNQWQSKVSFPLVRERYMLRRAILRHNFRAQPLFNLEPIGGTTPENAQNMQDVLNLNFKHTKFRQRAFSYVTDSVAKFGNGITYSLFQENNDIVWKTTVDELFGRQRVQVPRNRKNVYNYDIDIRNYWTNENISHTEDSAYQGHIERVTISDLMSEFNANPEAYINDNIKRVIKEAKESSLRDPKYNDASSKDWESRIVDKTVYWGRLNIRGNEDDRTIYYVEIVGEDVIRLQENPNDEGMVPYTIFAIEPRLDYWWSNVDSELVVPHENYMNMSLNMTADNVLRNMERYIFYDAGDIDIADLNERHKNGGWVPLHLKGKTLQQAVYEFQGRDTNVGALDWMNREVKESAQKLSTNPDFLRSGNKGGVANNTATAAQILSNIGDVRESDPLEQFSFGLVNMAERNAILLQQHLGDKFNIRPEPRQAVRELTISDILGRFQYNAESSLSKNYASEAFRLQNSITALLNFINSGHPAFQGIDLTKPVKHWIKQLNLPGDVDDIVKEQQQMMPGQVPSVQVPGAEFPSAVTEQAPALQEPVGV